VCGVLSFAALIIGRLSRFASEPVLLVWGLDVSYLSLLMASYLIRRPAKGRATGFAERYYPFLLPMLNGFLFGQVPWRLAALPVAAPLMVAGGGFYTWGAWNLRRNFSIMVEAREVVERGIYRYVRHPIYLGNILAISGAFLLRFNLLNLALWLAVIVGQVYRARLEERKLRTHCPTYAAYQARVPMFGLRIPRGLRRYSGRPTPL